MPGPAISACIERGSYEAIDEVVAIFRHDFAQYIGMIQSWVVLIEAELLAMPHEEFGDVAAAKQFHATTIELRQATARILNQTSAHLHPDIPRSPHQENTIMFLLNFWDTFFTRFIALAVPEIDTLEQLAHRFVTSPVFEHIIQNHLGSAAGNSSITDLFLQPFVRLRTLLDAADFDARVAELGL